MVEKKIFGISLKFHNFKDEKLLKCWDCFRKEIEKSCELCKWFSFFGGYCQELHIICPSLNKEKQVEMEYDGNEISLTSNEMDLFQVIDFESVYGVQGYDNHLFINVELCMKKYESPDLRFAIIIHEITHVFEMKIAEHYSLPYNSLNTIYQILITYAQKEKVQSKIKDKLQIAAEKYVDLLKFPLMEKGWLEKLKKQYYKDDINEIVTCQIEMNDKDVQSELLEYALELRTVEILVGDSVTSASIETFSLIDALDNAQQALKLIDNNK